ncbi:MAG: helix-turn-helix domain-containing protein [Anaerolineales bacterium]|nr:helix-turn-helix domain-containing protein [Anaerolineales bacterium]
MLEDIGNTLRETRENKGITLKEASEATFIRAHHLQALEAGDFSSMASAAQVRGFLRAYADFLGLDEKTLSLTPERQASTDMDAEISTDTQPVQPAPRPDKNLEANAIFSEIGAQLQERRELLGLSLEDVEQHTHIHKHYLSLLEAGQMEQFPSPVQARGMLSNYTTFLDLHPDRIMLRYADGLQARLEARQPERRASDARPSEPRPDTQPRAAAPAMPVWLRSLLSPDVLLVFFVAVAAILFGIWAFGRVMALRASEEVEPTAPPSVAQRLVPTTTPTATPEATAEINPGEDIPADGDVAGLNEEVPFGKTTGNVQVNVIVQHRAYLKVTVDGEVQLDQRVVPGSAFSYVAEEHIEVLTGDGAAIQVTYNQTDLGLLGILGEVVDVIYTSEGPQTPTPQPTATTDPNATPTITPSPSPTMTLEPTATQTAP